MICAHCSRETSPESGFCMRCGKPLDVKTVQVAAAVLTPIPESTADGLTTAPRSEPDGQAVTGVRPAEMSDGGDLTRLSGESVGSREAGGYGPLVPGTTLSPRYHIIRLLGIGGMGAVYQAWDAELGVTVALKVIRPESNTEEAVGRLERRFKQELLLARQVTHKNVVRIHDLGEINGVKYITMPYVEGADLASVLRKSGAMAVPDCVRIARDIVAGLQAAHDAGVVHRDLKPANIMIDGDHAVIMDFGIARSTSPAGAAKALGLSDPSSERSRTFIKPHAPAGATTAGAVVGTLEYMAPEQARGETVDQRADIYAFGLIVYDMLLGGRHHTAAKSALEDLTKRMEQAPPSPRTVNPQIPETLDEIVAKCVRPDAAERYQTTTELAAAFDRLDTDGNLLPEPRRLRRWHVAAAAVLLIAGVAGTWRLARVPVPAAEHPLVSVLISDFDNRTGDVSFEGSLEQALGLAVEGASFVTAYRRDDARKAVAQLRPGSRLDEEGAKLISVREGINVILAGGIETRGDGYLLNVRAIDAVNGKILTRASAAARTKADVLKTMGTIASKVRTTLGDTTPESAKLAATETVTTASLEALADYSRAQDLLYNSKDEDAILYYKRAIARDPNLGRAYSGWAISAGNLGRNEEAAEVWKKALSLVDRMTEREKHRTLGVYFLRVAQNYTKAIDSFEALVKLYPHDRGGHVNLALAYFYTRNFPKALEEGRRSVADAPNDRMNRTNLALYAMYAGDFATAAAEASTVIKQDSAFYRAYLPQAMAALAKADFEGARQAYEAMAKSGAPGASVANLGLADLALYQGRYRDATALLTSGISEDERRNNTDGMAAKYTALAEASLGEGRTAQAVAAAQRVLKLVGPHVPAVPAARVLVAAGNAEAARALAASLAEQIQPESRAYAKVLEGELALRDGQIIVASEAFLGAQKLVDVWWARLGLGMAYVQAEHYAEALGELERSQARRGETTAILLDDLPSFRYLAPLPYWLGRAQDGSGQRTAAVENYKIYLAIRPDAPGDRLAADARRRLESR